MKRAYDILYDISYEDIREAVSGDDGTIKEMFDLENLQDDEELLCELLSQQRHNPYDFQEKWGLLDSIDLPDDISEEDYCEYISDTTGYFVQSFKISLCGKDCNDCNMKLLCPYK